MVIELQKENVKKHFYYNNGELYRKFKNNVDKKVGSINSSGYLLVEFNGKKYSVHRLIYMLCYDINIDNSMQIDHINGNRLDNQISNLRLVTHQQNQWNRTKAKGYSWNKKAKKFYAKIKVNGKDKHIGSFDNEEDARVAYLNAKKIIHKI